MIAAEERKHLNIVENTYSFVESPKTFLAWASSATSRITEAFRPVGIGAYCQDALGTPPG
jgi:hypothetical protein